MTREDIKEMAMTYGYSNLEDAVDLALAVAKIATEYEREACADLCERHAAEPLTVRATKISDRPFSGAALDCAELIRATPVRRWVKASVKPISSSTSSSRSVILISGRRL